jgi:acyl carrier protein
MIVLMDQLPLNNNGKVDRATLEGHTGRARPTGLSSDYRAPHTETEQVVTDVWELLMDVAGVGVDDDFFELGGHSLMAVGITSELGRVSGVTVQPRHFYQNPTIAELATLLEELQAEQAGLSPQLAQLAQP